MAAVAATVNRILANAAKTPRDVSRTAALLCERLRTAGPAAVDELPHRRDLNVDVPEERAQALRVTIEASIGLLDKHAIDRFTELGVFAENEAIPVDLIARLWHATGGLSERESLALCSQLNDLALVSTTASGTVTLHDVLRDYLWQALGAEQLAEVHGMLVDAVAAELPDADQLHDVDMPLATKAWWELGDASYMWDHLIEHLHDAGRVADAEAVAGDLRWIGARLLRFGVSAPLADLAAIDTPLTARLRKNLARAAHLLTPTEPEHAVVDVLHSRVAHDPHWTPQVAALRNRPGGPRLVNRWPLPDISHPTLQRALRGAADAVFAMAVSPDGSWLAAAYSDGSVWVWNPNTGQKLTTLKGHEVSRLAAAPDGSWLAAVVRDPIRTRKQSTQIWNPRTGETLTTLEGHTSGPDTRFYLCAFSSLTSTPDMRAGSARLATANTDDSVVQIWDPSTGKILTSIEGHGRNVRGLAVTPDGSRLAIAYDDDSISVYDANTGKRLTTLAFEEEIAELAVSPDGSWLAIVTLDGSVRVWDPSTGREFVDLKHSHEVTELAVAHDGSRLATASRDEPEVRIWNPYTGPTLTTLRVPADNVMTLAVAPDGSWLATASEFESVIRLWALNDELVSYSSGNPARPVTRLAVSTDGSRLVTASASEPKVKIWNLDTGEAFSIYTDHADEVADLAVSPDGSWLATAGSSEHEVRIWNTNTGQRLTTLQGHIGGVQRLAIAPDGSWLAAARRNVWIWDPTTGQQITTIKGDHGLVTELIAAPDGSWLAAAWDGSVRIWEPTTGKVITDFDPCSISISALAAAPDGSWLSTANRAEPTVTIWDPYTGQKLTTLEVRSEGVAAMAASPNGPWLAIAGDEDATIHIWDTVSWQPVTMMRLEHEASACAWLGNTEGLVVGSEGGIYAFDMLTGAADEYRPA